MTPSRADLEEFRELIVRRLGLHHDDERLEFLADVLRGRMGLLGSPHPAAYRERLASPSSGPDELRALAELLTVNETFFFRNADSLRAFVEAALPARVHAQLSRRRLSILSAGCASGEEPYSLAILVREALPDLGAWDVNIVAVDINPAVIARARQARYSRWSLRATPEEARRRYFRADGQDFVLDPAIQRMVTFAEGNLVAEDPRLWQAHAYDVVFCRNVLMYFAPDKARGVVDRITAALAPDGFLFLGHAETLRGLSQEFHLCHTHDTFYYQRRGAAEPMVDEAARTLLSVSSAPAVDESTASWVEVVQRASERIAALLAQAGGGEPGAPSGPQVATPAARTWDLRPALAAVVAERYADALAMIQGLPPDAHTDPDALLLHAALLTNHGRIAESEAICRRLLALDELSAGAYYLLALCREHSGDPTGAIEHDRTAIYLDASFAMPHLHMGLLARRAGDGATARRELGQASLLLAREDAARVLLFGGGFSRETLLALCAAELRAAGGER